MTWLRWTFTVISLKLSTIAFLQTDNPRPETRNDPRPFVARHKWRRWFHRPIAGGGVKVGVTDAARDHLD
jgi:hypothetical protein